MLNKIIHFSLQNRITVLLVSLFLIVLGIYVTIKSEIDVFPDLNAPTVVIMTEAPGYAPEEIEKTVTFPIETVMNGATGVRRVRSSSTTGFSTVSVEFDWGTDIYQARQTVMEKLTTVTQQFPAGVEAPVLGPQTSILGEMLIVSLTADSTSMLDLRTIADRTIRPRLLALGGVSEVQVIGGDIKEYQILLDLDKLKYFNVTMQEVAEAANNINNNVGGGILYEYGNEYIVKGNINTRDLAAISNAVIRSDSLGIITLADIGSVKVGSKTPKLGTASEKGKPAVSLTITKQPNSDTNELTDKIISSLDELKNNLPQDVNISTDTFRQSRFINNSINNIEHSLIEGAIFVVIILFIFLMNFRTTIISLVALPLSVLITMIILHYIGYTINTMILGGIAIAIGSLVDDAIVDVENIFRRLRENRALPIDKRLPVIEIVNEASREVRMPIFNSSLIIMASFIPLFFLSGMEGRLLIPLGVAFIVSLLASTIVALTVTPVLCSYLLKADNENDVKESQLAKGLKAIYSKALKWSFSHKTGILASTGTFFIISIVILFTLGRSFLPPFNEGAFTINVSLMPGVSLEESDKIGREAEKIILSVPEITTVSRKTGRAELSEHSFGVNVSEIEAPYELSERTKDELIEELRHKLSAIPGANIEIGQPISHRIDAMLSGSKAQIAIKLFGDDLSKLYQLGSQIKNCISNIEGVVDVNLEQQVSRPQLHITPKRELMAQYGITMPQFAQFIRIALSGEVVSEVYDDGLPYDLTLKVPDEKRNTIEEIKNLPIDSNVGKIPLSFVANITSADGPNTINRENVSRRIIVSANVHERDLRGAVNDISDSINANVKLPEGYYIVYGGQFESEAQASQTLSIASVIALIIVFMLLYHEFKNTSQALTVLLNLPLAMIGGIFILFFTSGEMNIPAIIGFISLLGITTRNGMLLMSHYNHLRDEGMDLHHRIFTGSIDRLNPIIMTALSSALALIPLAVKSSEPGNEIQSPMAIVILGGLLTSTVLNLFIVPIIYYLNNKNKNE